jgi:hypothetical protein
MKMGNTRSLWLYDVGAYVMPLWLKLRQVTIPCYECRRYPEITKKAASVLNRGALRPGDHARSNPISEPIGATRNLPLWAT